MGDIWLAHNLLKTVVIVTCVAPVKMRFFFLLKDNRPFYNVFLSPHQGSIFWICNLTQVRDRRKKRLVFAAVRLLAAAWDDVTARFILAKNCRLEQKAQISGGKNHQQ